MKRAPIAIIAALAIGTLAGFMLGRTGPTRELRATRQELDEARQELEQAESPRGLRSPVPGLDRIMRASPRERNRARGDRGERGDEDGRASAGRYPMDAGVERGASADWDDGEDDESPLAAFERAASVQRVRNMQSRAALEQQAGLDEEELEAVDRAFAQMNEELVGYGEELILLTLEGERPPPRELLGITHDVTGILQRAQVRLEEVVGTERAANVDESALEVWNHVDLELLAPAARTALEGR